MYSNSFQNFLGTQFDSPSIVPSSLQGVIKRQQNAVVGRSPEVLNPTTAPPSFLDPINESSYVRFVIPKSGAIDFKSLRVYLRVTISVAKAAVPTAQTLGGLFLDPSGMGCFLNRFNVYLGSSSTIEEVKFAPYLNGMLLSTIPEDYRRSLFEWEKAEFNNSGTSGGIATGAGIGGYPIFKAPTIGAGADRTNFNASFTIAGSIAPPVGLFSTNAIFFAELYDALQVDITLNSVANVLVMSLGGAASVLPTTVSSYTIAVNEISLRYDKLTIQPDFQLQLFKAVQSAKQYEFHFATFKAADFNVPAASTTYQARINGVAGAALEAIMFGFTRDNSAVNSATLNSLFNNTYTNWESGNLNNFAFNIGGLQVPNRAINCSFSDPYASVFVDPGAGNAFAVPKSATIPNDNTEALIQLAKTRNVFKSYDVGMSGLSNQTLAAFSTDGTVGNTSSFPRILYGYSFNLVNDEEVSSALNLRAGEEMIINLAFGSGGAAAFGDPASPPTVPLRMFVFLRYAQILITDGYGASYVQM